MGIDETIVLVGYLVFTYFCGYFAAKIFERKKKGS